MPSQWWRHALGKGFGQEIIQDHQRDALLGRESTRSEAFLQFTPRENSGGLPQTAKSSCFTTVHPLVRLLIVRHLVQIGDRAIFFTDVLILAQDVPEKGFQGLTNTKEGGKLVQPWEYKNPHSEKQADHGKLMITIEVRESIVQRERHPW